MLDRDQLIGEPVRAGAASSSVLWLTVATWAVLVVMLGAPAFAGALADRLGDTDDALRLTLVRDLISGRAGWWDQHLARLQPPLGMDLHWSRLVDGGIAGVEQLFRLALAPGQAEYAARVAWPLLWIGPAVAAALSIARRLRGDNAAVACAALLAVTHLIFWQWAPGRIDHHDLQITAALCALAGAVSGTRRGGWLAGAATAGGLAVGIEGLAFLGLVGVAFALRFALDPMRHTGPARAYAAALLLGLLGLFLIETPPAWLGVSRCDALGANLTAAVASACLGLLATTTAARSGQTRFAGLIATGALAAAVYLGLEPACIHGPFAQADPRIKPIWLSKVAEVQPLAWHIRRLEAEAVCALGMLVLGVVSWLWLGRRSEGRTAAWMTLGACLLAAGLMGVLAARLICYSSLFAAPPIAAAVADVADRFRKGRTALVVGLAVALSPSWPTAAAANLAAKPAARPGGPARSCTAPSAFAVLARLPAGVVLSEIDLGPYILASTPHAVLAAPYHRADWGIIAADAALASSPGRDEAAVRSLHVDYVVECRSNAWYPRRKEIGPASLQVRLDRGENPAWLKSLSPAAAGIQVYRVLSAPAD